MLFNALFVVIFSFLSALFSIKFHGTEEHVIKICNSLIGYIKETCYYGGAIHHLKDQLVPAIKDVLSNHNYRSVIQWASITFYCFIPILYLLMKSKFKENNFIKLTFKLDTKIFFIICFMICFVSILPLFVIAFDWGRWISIYYHLIAFFLIYFYANKEIKLENSNLFNKTLQKNVISRKIIIFAFLYATFITPTVFDKINDDNLNPYKLNYIIFFNKFISNSHN